MMSRNCAPPNNGRPSAIISMRRPSCTSGAKMSKSRTCTLVETRAPPSWQIRAPMLSTANPRLPRTPALLHGRPHRQVRETKGNGKWTRRSKSTRNKWGLILVASWDGVAINAAPANGPLWERNVACSISLNRLRRNSRCRRSTREDASCCHFRFAQPGSYSSMNRGGGRPPSSNAVHDGGSNPSTPTKFCPASRAAAKDAHTVLASNSSTIGIRPAGPESTRKQKHWCEQHFGGPSMHNGRDATCGQLVALIWCNPQNVAQTTPETSIVIS